MTDKPQEGSRSRQAIRKCADWLSYCLSIGWRKSDLDALQALWWKYHDENGELTVWKK